MRFACIEFTTKAGKIWRPTPERPNYLCDPEREIDPTSFGCYTSALHGEHVPLTGLIYGSLDRPPSRFQRARHNLARRTRGTFAPYDLSYLKQFDVLLVIYQLSNDGELVRFVQRVRTELPNILLVSCSSPPFGRLREYWKDHPETIVRYQTFLNSTHLNMNVCRATVPFTRLLTTTPSVYLPQPYPVEYAVACAQKTSKRRPIVYVAGDTVRPDIVTGHLIANVLQQHHPELHIRVTKTPGFSLNTAFLKGTRFEVVPFRPWADQVHELASVRLVINTDLWWTRGRVPVDCAAAGVPCVGTTSDGQTELWPELASSESTDVDRLIALAERALTDDAFRAAVVSKAQRRLTQYAYGPTIQRFAGAVELTRAGRLAAWRDPVWKDDMLVWPTP
ncbi:MAG: hypothetical protein G01um101438_582 [Parcubacteria group bacterium Gr01-1014_38]|nr:MAG: hypothetical protein G01um101438_582 [Parcubacteria group bacterium Gr01-1014_38]